MSTEPERRSDGFLHRRLDVGEVTLHVVESRPAGDLARAPLVVLLHGFPEFWWSWRHQLEALAAAGYWVVAPDLRGYNESDKPDGVDAYRLESLASDIDGLVRALGRDAAFVVGHDWGGVVAWQFAQQHPERVEKLAILNVPHPLAMMRGLRRPAQLAKSWYMFFFQAPLVPEKVAAAADYLFLRNVFRLDGTPEADIDRYIGAIRAPGALTAAMNYYRSLLRRGALGTAPKVVRIDRPVLVIWGDKDHFLGKELATPPPRFVPNARVVHLPDASHWVQNAAPARVNALLVDFFGEATP
jgi:pimeloyl-ACP methyl ester carboxylesterase